jgi:hypothetical protein
VKYNLADTLLYEFKVGRSHQAVIPDAHHVLQHRQEIWLSRGVQHKIFYKFKTIINIIKFKANVIKPFIIEKLNFN